MILSFPFVAFLEQLGFATRFRCSVLCGSATDAPSNVEKGHSSILAIDEQYEPLRLKLRDVESISREEREESQLCFVVA